MFFQVFEVFFPVASIPITSDSACVFLGKVTVWCAHPLPEPTLPGAYSETHESSRMAPRNSGRKPIPMRMLDTNSPKMKSTSSPQGPVRPKMMGLVEKGATPLEKLQFLGIYVRSLGCNLLGSFFNQYFLGFCLKKNSLRAPWRFFWMTKTTQDAMVANRGV